MLSRVAESIYWMNRYIERAENVARLIDVNIHLTLGEQDLLGEQWMPLVRTTGDQPGFLERYDARPTRTNVLNFLLFDDENPNSVISCVKVARENARRIRQAIPIIVWEQLNKFYHFVLETSQNKDLESVDDIQEFCERVRLASHLIAGAEDATSLKNQAWYFARLGRMLERADYTSRIVDVQYYILLPDNAMIGSTFDVVRWAALLRSANGLMLYRRKYGNLVPVHVAEFLLLDPLFSRSTLHCIAEAEEALFQIVNDSHDVAKRLADESFENSNALWRTVLDAAKLSESMKNSDARSILNSGIHEYIDRIQTELNHVGNLLQEEFFTWTRGRYQPPARQSSKQSQKQGSRSE